MKFSLGGKDIAVIGLGVEGLVSARYLRSKGATVTVLDAKSEQAIEKRLLRELQEEGISFLLGDEYLAALSEFDVVVRSPGIKRSISEISAAEKQGVVITSQTQLFLDMCPCPVIGVTGTKGKGTTSSLIYEMLKESGEDAYLGGNIGRPPFEFLDTLTPQSKVVLEMSSYQLQDLTTSPHIAVMLMVTSEHLAPDRPDGKHQNYHEDIAEYVEAKRTILRHQTPHDFAVLNRDYPATNESDVYTQGHVYYVSSERVTKNGCYVKEGAIWLDQDGKEKKVIDTKAILLPGRHNWENACAATMVATLAGVALPAIQNVLKTFRGLEHRLELVTEVDGVAFYNDSFSTTPETAIAAIEAFERPEVLILGGASKRSDFTELGRVITQAKNVKAIIGIGLEWPQIKKHIDFAARAKGEEIEVVEGAKTMEHIVRLASSLTVPGDVVLLSPACSSFDMFPNYKVRGIQFKEEVHKLTQQ